jgi:hypothetical protein
MARQGIQKSPNVRYDAYCDVTVASNPCRIRIDLDDRRLLMEHARLPKIEPEIEVDPEKK